MATIGSLVANLTLESAQFIREANRANNQLRQLNTSFGAMSGTVRTLGAALGGLASAFSVRELARAGQEALNTAGNLAELATRAGVTTTELQKLEFAALQVGVRQEQLINLLSQFGRRVGEAAQGTGTLADTFKRYGIAVRDSTGNVRSSVEVLGDLAEAVQNAGSAQERLTLVSGAFGARLGSQLLPLLVGGREGLQQFGDMLERVGGVLDQALIASADRAADSLASLQFIAGQGFRVGVVEEFAGAINITEDNLRMAAAAGENLGRIVGNLLSGFASAATILVELNKNVKSLTGGFLSLSEAIALPAKQLELYIDLVARLFDLTAAPDTSLEAIAPPEVVARINEMREALSQLGDGGLAVLSKAAQKAAEDIANLRKELEAQLQQQQALNQALAGGGTAGGVLNIDIASARDQQEIVERVTDTIEIYNQLTKGTITLEQARAAGLDKLAIQLQATTNENEKLQESLQARVEIQDITEQQALQLRFAGQETEEYRVQLRLLQLRNEFGAEFAKSQEGAVRILEAQSTAIEEAQKIEAERLKEAERQADLMLEPYLEAARSIQSALSDAIVNAFDGGIKSAEDFGQALIDIMKRTAADIIAARIMEPIIASMIPTQAEITSMLRTSMASRGTAAGGAQVAGWQQGLVGGPAPMGPPPPGGGFMGTGISGGNLALTGLGGAALGFGIGSATFGGGPGSQIGGAVGGGIGAAAGAALGSMVPGIGTALGTIAGGTLGSVLGSSIGSVFGGGGDQDNKVRIAGARLGTIMGTSAAAAFSAEIDRSLQSMLSATEERVASRALKTAQGVAVQYDKELSAADKERLARGRIGPVAGALGFDVKAITTGTPEDMVANLQTAIQLQKTISGFRLGPLDSSLRDLSETFNEMEAEAKRLGVSTAGLSEEYAKQRKLIGLEFRRQDIQFEASAGVITGYTAAQRLLRVEYEQSKVLAEQYGVSLKDLKESFKQGQQALRLQRRAEDVQFSLSVGVIDQFEAEMALLRIQFEQAELVAEQYGISQKQLNEGYREARQALKEQQQAQRVAQRAEEAAQQKQHQVQRVEFLVSTGIITEYTAAQKKLQLEWKEAKKLAEEFGVALNEVNEGFRESRTELRLQRRAEDIQFTQKFGGISEFKAEFLLLENDFRQGKLLLDDFGLSMGQLVAGFREARRALELSQQGRVIEFQASLGIIDDYTASQRSLRVQFEEARLVAEDFGISVRELNDAFKEAQATLRLQRREEKIQFQLSAGVINEFQAEWAMLVNDFRQARLVAEELGVSIEELVKGFRQAKKLLELDQQSRTIQFKAGLGIISQFEAEQQALNNQFAQAVIIAEMYGVSVKEVTAAHKEAQRELRRTQQAELDAMARSIVDPFEALIDPLRALGIELDRSMMNPLQQAEAAQKHWDETLASALTGNIAAIEHLDEAGRDLIATAEAIGASPAAVAATQEVQAGISAVIKETNNAQKEASRGLENVIKKANDREIDTLKELIAEARHIGDEIRKLGRALT